ncbi:hypothetical protein SprV_0301310000 [Sparganum proliferum]
MKRSMDLFTTACINFGLVINTEKTVVMHRLSLDAARVAPQINVNGIQLQVVDSFTYLTAPSLSTPKSTMKWSVGFPADFLTPPDVPSSTSAFSTPPPPRPSPHHLQRHLLCPPPLHTILTHHQKPTSLPTTPAMWIRSIPVLIATAHSLTAWAF